MKHPLKYYVQIKLHFIVYQSIWGPLQLFKPLKLSLQHPVLHRTQLKDREILEDRFAVEVESQKLNSLSAIKCTSYKTPKVLV